MSMSKSKQILVERKRRITRSRFAMLSVSTVASMYASSVSRGQIVNYALAGVSGWNQDLVAETPLSSSTTEGFDTVNGQDYYVNGLFANNVASGTYGAGLPTSGILNSATGTTQFQFQSYTANNALFLSPLKTGTGNNSGMAPSVATLTLATPSQASSLAFLVSSTNGSQTIDYTLNYADGTTATSSFTASDWFNGTVGVAAAGLGRTNNRIVNTTQGITIDTGQSNSSSGNPRLYEIDVPTGLLSNNSTGYLSSITFSSPNTNSNATAIYAVSGVLGQTLTTSPLTFTGKFNGNVDNFSPNWANSSNPQTTFTNGVGPIIFDDTVNSNLADAQGNINLNVSAGGISPTNMIFNSGNYTYILNGGPVTGPGGLIVNNSNGLLIVNNTNTFLGNTNVSNGAWLYIKGQILSPNINIGPGSKIVVFGGGQLGGTYNSVMGTVINPGITDNGELDLAASSQTIGYLSGSGLLSLSGGATITIGAQAAGLTTFSGTIAGSGNLNFRGPLTLSGASTFVGNSSFGVSSAVLLGNPLALGAVGNTFQISGGGVVTYDTIQQMGGIGASTPLTGANALPYNYSFGGTNLFGFSGLNSLELTGNATNWNTSGAVFDLIAVPSAKLTLSGQIGVGGGGLFVTGGGSMILNNSSGTNALTGTLAIGPSSINGVTPGDTTSSASVQLNGSNELGSINTISVSYSGASVGSSLVVNDNSGNAGFVGGNSANGVITTTIYGLGAPLAQPNASTGVTVPLGFGALRGADGVASIWAGNVSVGSATSISGGINGSLTLTGIVSGSSQIQFSLNTNSVTTLSAVNTYTGETALNGSGGTLKLGANGAIATSSDLNLDLTPTGTANTTFDLAGFNTSIGYLVTTSSLPATSADKITNTGSKLSTLALNGSGGSFYGSIQETTGGHIAVVLNNTGTQTFGAPNNYSGGTTLNGSGSLLGGTSSSFGTGTITINNGYLGSSNASGIVVSNPLAFGQTNGIGLNITNPINISSNLVLPAGTITAFKTTGTDPNGNNGLFSGNISGGGAVNIVGSVEFTGNNTYSGGTNLSAGSSLAITGDTLDLGTGPVNFLGGALTFVHYTSNLNFSNASGSTIPVTLGATAGAPSTLAGNISGGAGFTFVGPGILILTGNNTYTGPTTITGGELSYSSAFPLGTLTLNGGGVQYPAGVTTDLTSGGHTLVLGSNGGIIDTNGNNVTFAGAIVNASSGSLTKTGAGTLSDTAGLSLANFYVRGGTSGASSTFALNGTTSTLTASGTVGIGEASGDKAVLTLNNGANLSAGTLNVGDAVASGTALPVNNGTLNISDTTSAGTIVSSTTANIGYANGGTNATGLVNQTGGLFKSTSTLNLGVNGIGVYNISGGTSNVSSMYLSTTATGSGTYNQLGGITNETSSLELGEYNKGTINVAGGTFNLLSSGYIGYYTTGGNGVINVTGGVFNASGGNTIYYGYENPATLNLSGGVFNTNDSIYAGYYTGTAFFNQTGGTFNSSASLYLSYDASSTQATYNLSNATAVVANLYIGYIDSGSATGTMNILNGGTLVTGSVSTNGTTGIGAYLNLNGGTLKANASSTAFVSTTVTMSIGALGGAINTNGFNDTIPGNIITGVTGGPDGGLTKAGAGTLTLSGTNTFTGPVNVNGGFLVGSSVAAFGSGSAINLNGGALTISSDAFYNNLLTLKTVNLNGGGLQIANYNSSAINISTPNGFMLGATGVSAFNGSITAASLNYVGPGSLFLHGSTSYSGTTLTSGSLFIDNDAQVGSGPVTFAGGSLGFNGYATNLNFNNSGAFATSLAAANNGTGSTLNGVISGTAGFTFVGPGALTLTGINTYTGPTNIAGGVLVVNPGTLPVGPINLVGGTYQYSGGNTTDLTTGGGTLALGSGGGGIDTNGNNITFGGNVSGANLGAFTKSGAGSLTIVGTLTPTYATIQGGSTANPSVLNFNGPTAVFSANSTSNGFSIGEQTGDYGVLNVSNGASVTVGSGGINVADQANAVTNNPGVSSDTGIINLNGSTSVITSGGPVAIGKGFSPNNQSFGTVNQYAGTFQTSGATVIGVNNQSTGIYNLNAGLASLNSVTLAQNAGSVGVFNFSGGTLKVNSLVGGSGTSTLNVYGGVLLANSSSTSFVTGITNLNVYAAGLNINTSGYNDTISGAILSGVAGDGGLIKTGLGTLTLSSNASTYTGLTQILQGGVVALGTHPFGAAGDTINISSGVTLTQGSDLGAIYTINFLGNSSSYTFANYNSSMNIVTPPNVTLGALTGTPSALTGTITGSGSVTYVGPGTLILTNAGNTYSGGTNLSAGSLIITSDAAVGSGPITFAGGALGFSGYTSTLSLSNASGSTIPVTLAGLSGTTSTFGGTISGAAGLTYVGPGNLILAGTNSYTGATNISGGLLSSTSALPVGPLILNGGGYQYSSGSNTDFTSGGRTFTVTTAGGTIDTNGNNVAFAGAINSSTGAFTKVGVGTLSISSAMNASNFTLQGGTTGSPSGFSLNSTSGFLNVPSGTVAIGEASGDNAVLSLNNGAKIAASTLKVGDAVASGTSLPFNNGILNLADTAGSGSKVNTATLYLGYANGGTNAQGVINQSAGTFQTSGTAYIGYNGTGLFNAAGGLTTFASTTYLGYASTGLGIYNVSGGHSNFSSTTYIGYNGPGVFNQAGGASTLTSTTYLGYSAPGTINVTGGTFNSSSVYLGYNANAPGVINVSNGLFNTNSSVYVGYISSPGTVNITGGSFNSSSSFIVGYEGGGTMNLSAGAFYSTSTVYVSYLYSNGIVNQTGGKFTTTGNMYLDYDTQGAYKGVYNLSSGTATIAGSLYIGYLANTGSVGLFNVGNGTTLQVGSISTNGTTGVNAQVVVNGGTIKANSSSTSFITSPVSTVVGALGMTVNTNGFNDTISGNIVTGVTGGPDGGLTKTGLGVLTLSGNNTYTGVTNINGGGVIANGPAPFGPQGNVVNINPGGVIGLTSDSSLAVLQATYTINFNGGGYLLENYNSSGNYVTPLTIGAASGTPSAILGKISGAGALTYVGPGNLILTNAANSYSGGTNLAAGALYISNDAALGTGPLTFAGGALGFYGYSSTMSLSNASGSTIAPALAVLAGTTYTFVGSVSGGAGFTDVGPGNLIMAGSNTYTGPTNVSGGLLSFASAVPQGGLILNGGGFQYSSGSTIDFTSGGSTFTIGSAGGLIDTNGNNVAFAGPINSSSGSFSKVGIGTLSISGSMSTSNFNVSGGNSVSPSGFAVNGTTGSLTSTGTLGLGEVASDNAILSINNGAQLSVSQMNIGDATSSNGTLNIADTTLAGTLFKASSTIYLGYNGNGTLNMTGGTANISGSVYVSYNSTSNGLFNQSGGIVNDTGSIYFGYSNTGTGVFSGGTFNASSGVYFGYINKGVVTIAGGNFRSTSTNTVYLGYDTSSTLNISSGSFFSAGTLQVNFSNSGVTDLINQTGGSLTAPTVIVGSGGSGNSVNTYNLSNGTATIGTLYLASGSGQSGTLNLNSGGVLQVSTISSNGTTGYTAPNGAFLNVNGGTLVANSSSSSLVSGLSSFNIGALGATINTNGFSATIPQVISSGVPTDGGLIKTGAGTLTLSGNNTYNGGTTVNGGTLSVGTAHTVGTGPVTVNTGGTLSLTGSGVFATTSQPIVLAGGTLQGIGTISPGTVGPTTSGLGAWGAPVQAGTSGFTATNTGTVFNVTQSGIGSFASAIWTPFTIDDSKIFTLTFTYNHSTSSGANGVADGIAFGFQNDSRGLSALGGNGGGEGYSNANSGTPISPSEVGYFDLYGENYGLGSNGTLTSAGTTNAISNTSGQTVTLTYNGPTRTFTSTINVNGTLFTSTANVDLAALFGGTAGGTASTYFGFSGATGGVSSTQNLSNVSYNYSNVQYGAFSVANPVSLTASTTSALQFGSSGSVGSLTFGASAGLNVSVISNTSAYTLTSTGPISMAAGSFLNLPAALNRSAHGLLVAGSGLTLAGGTGSWTSSVDLANNDMIVHGGDIGTVTNELQQGYNGGSWNGSGIRSSSAAADLTHLTALGSMLDSGSITSFDGATVGAGDVLVRYTYYGDATLDGSVNSADYTLIDTGYLTGATGWQNGDFNYDGVINGSDYTLIDNAFNTQGAQISAQIAAQVASGPASAVPEPTSLGLLGLGAIGLLGRRRRHSHHAH